MSQTRNTIAWFMKTYLHRPIKILQFFTRGRIQRMFDITSKYFSIFNNSLHESWVKHTTRDFFTCYSCSYYAASRVGLWTPSNISDETLKWSRVQLKAVNCFHKTPSWMFGKLLDRPMLAVIYFNKASVLVQSKKNRLLYFRLFRKRHDWFILSYTNFSFFLSHCSFVQKLAILIRLKSSRV